MVGKDDEHQLDDEGLARVKLIADRKKHLEQTAELVQDQIKSSFERLSAALRGREKQLLRQVEAVHRQQLSLVQSSSEHLVPTDSVNLKADLASEQELLERVLDFGRIKLSNLVLAVNNCEPYKAEEYIEAGEDVVNFDKSLKTEADEFDVSSVIRRKRGTLEPISINLNCTSCSAKYAAADNTAASGCSSSKKFDESPLSPESNSSCSYDYESGLLKKNEDDVSSSEEEEEVREKQEDEAVSEARETETSSTAEITAQIDKFSIEDDSSNGNCAIESTEASKSVEDDNSTTAKAQQDRPPDGNAEHPIQIQQWLQQILAETETEPIIHEIGQIISKIPPKPRLYREFPVET